MRWTVPLLVSLAVPVAFSAEVVQLKSGARFEISHHEREGDDVWLYAASGFIHVKASEIRSLEEIPKPGEAAPAAAPKPKASIRSGHSDPVRRKIDEAAFRHGLPPAIVHAVAKAESNYRQEARSPVGAIGIMQLMPGTARDLGANPRDEEENIDAGTRYLRGLLLKYQNNPDQVALALAAYNAGPAAVDRYRGVPPYRETRTYVRRVIGNYEKALPGEEAAPAQAVPVEQPAVESIPVVAPQVVTPTVVNAQ